MHMMRNFHEKQNSGKVYLSVTNPALELVPPFLETNVLHLYTNQKTVRRDLSATSLTLLYNGEVERLSVQ
jgi:hypothetical protein